MRTENVIIEWQSVQEQIPELQEAAEREEYPLLQTGPISAGPEAQYSRPTAVTLVKSQDATLAVIQAATATTAGSWSDQRAMVMQNTSRWLDELLDCWTTLYNDAERPDSVEHAVQDPTVRADLSDTKENPNLSHEAGKDAARAGSQVEKRRKRVKQANVELDQQKRHNAETSTKRDKSREADKYMSIATDAEGAGQAHRTKVPTTSSNTAAEEHVRKGASIFTRFLPPELTGTKGNIPERKVSCFTCGSDDVPLSKSAKFACAHRMCHKCLRRLFNMSISDPALMPPKCCTSESIPLKHVEKLFSRDFKITWNRKFREFNTRDRIYCPYSGCGEWISPNHITIDHGRKVGKCKRCNIRVCCICKREMHSGACPNEISIGFAEPVNQRQLPPNMAFTTGRTSGLNVESPLEYSADLHARRAAQRILPTPVEYDEHL